MAKCIKMYDGPYEGRTIRVPDDYARRLVNEKRAEFAPKEAWKLDGRVVRYGKGVKHGS